jgi:hypothetical protein
MPLFKKFKIETYTIELGQKGFYEIFSAILFCNGKNDKQLKILFYEHEPDRSYNNTSDLQTGQGELYVHIKLYPFYLDLLRNESPVYAHIHKVPKRNKLVSGIDKDT